MNRNARIKLLPGLVWLGLVLVSSTHCAKRQHQVGVPPSPRAAAAAVPASAATAAAQPPKPAVSTGERLAEYQRHFRSAQQKEEAEDWPGAISELEAALRSIPNHPVALRELGRLTLESGDPWKKAKQVYQRALTASASPQQRAAVLAGLGQLAEAESDIDAAFLFYKQSRDAWWNRDVQKRLINLPLRCQATDKPEDVCNCLLKNPPEQLFAPYVLEPRFGPVPNLSKWSCKQESAASETRRIFVLRNTEAWKRSPPPLFFDWDRLTDSYWALSGRDFLPPLPKQPAPPAEVLRAFQQSLQAGKQREQANDLLGAMTELEAALELIPDDPIALSELGWVAVQLCRPRKAQQLLDLVTIPDGVSSQQREAVEKKREDVGALAEAIAKLRLYNQPVESCQSKTLFDRLPALAKPCAEPRPLEDVCKCLEETHPSQFYEKLPLFWPDEMKKIKHKKIEVSCRKMNKESDERWKGGPYVGVAGARLFQLSYQIEGKNSVGQQVVVVETGKGWSVIAPLVSTGGDLGEYGQSSWLIDFKETRLGSVRVLWAEFGTIFQYSIANHRNKENVHKVMVCVLDGTVGAPRCIPVLTRAFEHTFEFRNYDLETKKDHGFSNHETAKCDIKLSADGKVTSILRKRSGNDPRGAKELCSQQYRLWDEQTPEQKEKTMGVLPATSQPSATPHR